MWLRRHIGSWLPESPPARSFVILTLLLGSLYAVVNPPFTVNDEKDHWLRVLEIGKGRLRSRADEQGAYYRLPRDYYELIKRYWNVPRDPHARVSVGDLAHDLTTPAEQPPRWMRRFANASAYSPVPYLPQLPAVWLARVSNLPPLWQVYLARLLSLSAYALIGA
jgi:uncharacterized membrane protein